MEWIRGMAKGKWVKGNGIRPGASLISCWADAPNNSSRNETRNVFSYATLSPHYRAKSTERTGLWFIATGIPVNRSGRKRG